MSFSYLVPLASNPHVSAFLVIASVAGYAPGNAGHYQATVRARRLSFMYCLGDLPVLRTPLRTAALAALSWLIR